MVDAIGATAHRPHDRPLDEVVIQRVEISD